MNREQKRMLQRQGQLAADGVSAPAPKGQQPRPNVSSRAAGTPRRTPIAYLRDVRNELRKVNWPSRAELRNYSVVVLFTLVLMIALIFGLDYAFSEIATFLFK